MEFCYLIIFESAEKKIEPITIEDDNPKLLEKVFDKFNYDFTKPLKKRDGFSKLYDGKVPVYYKVVPCLKTKDRFFELKELTNL
jgi:hypothetical protein